MDNNSKIAIVTGGSRGLGRDMVINLAQNGNNIIFSYHSNKTEADKVVAEVLRMGQKAVAFQLDISNMASVDAFVRQSVQHLEAHENVPRFDFLVNNAGTGLYQTIANTTEQQLDDMFNVHFKGVYLLTQKLLPYIQDGGRIVNISSGLTRVSFAGSSAYACMKGAVEVLTRYLAKELGSRKITANTIAPGAIATDFGGGSNKQEDKQKVIASITALGRVGEPEDIGAAVAFLCSDAAAWITGQRIELSGGMMV